MASTAEVHQCPYLKVFQLESARNKGNHRQYNRLKFILINTSAFSV